MKKIFTLLLLLSASMVFSQNSGITYQAVIYGPNGQQLPGANNQQYILANKTICLRFSIIDQTGTVEYQETIVTTTDKFGMVNLLIGTGTQVSGYSPNFAGIVWNANTKSLKVELDPSQNCQNFTQISNNPFTYVPFAYFSANPGLPGPAGPQGIQGVAGVTGNNGAQGIQGLPGSQGPIGLTGATGPQGPTGLTGLTGATGPQGPIGLTGPAGPQGIQGFAGTTGAQGPPGTNGQNGLSAYQIWLNNGSTGTEAQFLTNLQGASGAQGPVGPQGPIGLTGPTGSQGLQGNTGTTGPQGPIGLTGPAGSQGIQGLAGSIGATGATGAQGPPGTNGQNGLSAYQIWLNNGSTGTEAQFLTNLQGASGAQGPVGPQGHIGLTGPTGSQGPQGNTGTTGAQGPIGLTGATGAQGPSGTNGQNGLSAYQIWLNAGNTGSETQFLSSLQGSTGPQGLTGTTGVQGPAGVNGTNGTNGTDGISAYQIWLNAGNTGTETQFLTSLQGSTGPQGLTGTTGAQGPAGVNGTSGTNGQNGLSAYQIWLNAGNTGTETQFLTSLQGATGPQGLTGAIGATGLQGPQGIQGPAGVQGLQGIIGQAGPQGPTGLLSNGTNAGNTPYWNGSQWIINNSNIHNNGAGVGIGTDNPNTSAKLEISSSTQGFLPPRMTTTQRDAITTPAIGLVIYNTSTNCLNFFIGSGWNETCGTPILPIGSVATINCGSATNTGTLTQGTAASGVSSSITYTGGNGGSYDGQTITSTGVTGLTATLSSGIFANGNGALVYSITGTPSASGTASFALNIGGQTCTFNRSVAINLVSQYSSGSVFCNSVPTAIVDVTNPTTGKIWMDRNLGASQAATSSTDVNSYGDLYQWGRGSDGHQCRNSATTTTLSSSDQPGNGNFIIAGYNDWRTPSNTNLWQGINSINNPCPSGYRLPTLSELSAERSSWSSINSIGAFASPLKFSMAGFRSDSNGNAINVGDIGFVWSSTITSTDRYYLDFGNSGSNMSIAGPSNGRSVRCIKDASAIIGRVGSINCGSATNTGTLTQGTAASGVSTSIPYIGGNGGSYDGQTIASTGVTGLTATLSSGIFANGNGALVYNISGTPSASGTASFALNIGGQTCTLNLSVAINLVTQYPAGSVFCASGPTAIVDVTNPTTGKIWMDRNLGASQAATSSTDPLAYGDLYQWGRGSDGHQCRNSATTTTLSSTDQPGNNNFILAQNFPNDWRLVENNNLWLEVNSVNNPCPSGYRLPSDGELDLERRSWGINNNNSNGAFTSPLKLIRAGRRSIDIGSIDDVNIYGFYWSGNGANRLSQYLEFFTATQGARLTSTGKASGYSIRCIKDASAIIGRVGSINCGTATNTGTLTQGTAASGVSSSIPYTGGNGGSYDGQTIASTGVTGLTATLSSGIFANGNGALVYSITGTPSASGTVSFALTIGGQSCTLQINVSVWPSGYVHCGGIPTTVVEVVSTATGRIWMDRNLGATQLATSATDTAAYGDLFQWGRGADGHQCRNSNLTSTSSSSDQVGNSNFIRTTGSVNSNPPTAPFLDWRSPQNDALWQGVNGTNNPCPSGFRLPTTIELNAELTGFSTADNINLAYQTSLKFVSGGLRLSSNGNISFLGSGSGGRGTYWTSIVDGVSSINIWWNNTGKTIDTSNGRGLGAAIRCIKN